MFARADSSVWDGNGPAKVVNVMIGRRFDEITSDLRHEKFEPPVFCDKFHEVREMIKSLNGNMKKKITIIGLLFG